MNVRMFRKKIRDEIYPKGKPTRIRVRKIKESREQWINSRYTRVIEFLNENLSEVKPMIAEMG